MHSTRCTLLFNTSEIAVRACRINRSGSVVNKCIAYAEDVAIMSNKKDKLT